MTKIKIPRYQINHRKELRISKIKERCTNKTIPIHRHNYYEIIIITKTSSKIQSHEIDFVSYELKEGYIYFIYPNQTHKWNYKKYNGEFEGYIINFNEAFLIQSSNEIKQLLLILFNPFGSKPYLNYKINELETTFPILKIFLDEYEKKEQNNDILKSLLQTLLYYMAKLKKNSTKIVDSNFAKLNKVKNLIEDNFKENKNVNFYAKEMELSSKRLNEIVKKVSGLTVTQIIHQRLILEAKREIVSRVKNMQEIADELGFENPSYFSRFFKKYEHISPKEYSLKLLK